MNPSLRFAQSTRACRRRAASTTPVGDWCAGVTTTTWAPLSSSAATSTPRSSTGTWTVRKPVPPTARTASLASALPYPGSSKAAHRTPAWASTRHEDEPLREPGADDHLPGVSGGGAHPPQVPGEHAPQHGAATGVAIVKVEVGHAAAGLAGRPDPVAPRKARQVGDPAAEVRDQARRRLLPGRRLRRCPVRAHRDPGGRAGLAGQVPLGQQLAVAVLHQATGGAQLPGQLPG